MSLNPGTRDDEKGYFFILLFLDEKKHTHSVFYGCYVVEVQIKKSCKLFGSGGLRIVCLRVLTCAELAKNPKLTLQSFNSIQYPGQRPVQPFDKLRANGLGSVRWEK
jgi:hypothetical protein